MSDFGALLAITIARKPLSETSVARNVLRWGTGAINIDGCRLPLKGEVINTPQSDPSNRRGEVGFGKGFNDALLDKMHEAQRESAERTNALGRWPSNLVLQHKSECEESQCVDDCPVADLDGQSGRRPTETARADASIFHEDDFEMWEGGSGSAARYFKQVKG